MKKVSSLIFALLMLFVMGTLTFAEGQQADAVVDSANLLTDSQESALANRITQIKENYSYDLFIHTAPTAGGKDVEAYADDFYDENGYGFGEDRSGMGLVIIMDTRDYYITTAGLGIDIFNDDVIDYLGDTMVRFLSSGDYYNAFNAYLSEVERYLYEYENGVADDGYSYNGNGYISSDNGAYSSDNSFTSSRAFEILTRELTIIVIAFVIAFVVVTVMKKKMNTAQIMTRADEYMKQDSFKLNNRQDVFLYDTVTKTAKPQDDDNSSSRPSGGGGFSGGSSTHMSSGGVSHGGGGGKF